MSTWSLVGGVAAFNACLLVVGYAVSLPFLRGLDHRARASYAGLCLLVGAALVGSTLSMLAYTRVRIGLPAFAIVAAGLIAAGVLARLVLRLPARRTPASPPERAFRPALAALVAGYVIVAVGLLALVGGFRSSPWLDDSWFFWLPKGISLDRLGLRDEFFQTNPLYVPFDNPDYPFWWSIVMNLDMRFVGGIDMRAANAQLTFFELAFVGSVLRLLWGHVRRWVLLAGVALLIVSPELLREAQGGSADFPLAIFLALFALCSALWLARRDGYALFCSFGFAASVMALKLEGWPLVLITVVVASAFAVRAGLRTLWPFWATAFAAALTAVPWYRWKSNVAPTVEGEDVVTWSYLSDRIDRLRRAAGHLAAHAFDPSEWSFVVVLTLALALVLWRRERRLVWLAPFVGFALLFLFWMVAFWTAPEDRIKGSVYRTVMSVILPAVVFLPVLAERLLAKGEKRRSGAP